MNREEWLIEACKYIVPSMKNKTTLTIPDKFYISVGFPKGHAGRQRVIGQCWSGLLSQDGNPHIFICPTLDNPITILATVVHELIHTALPEGTGHKADFAYTAKKCGLIKPWVSTSPSDSLIKELTAILEKLPEYEHAALAVPVKGKKGSRMRKHMCTNCETIVYKGADKFNAICKEEVDGEECNGSFELVRKEEEEG